jgi:hypothetical protein
MQPQAGQGLSKKVFNWNFLNACFILKTSVEHRICAERQGRKTRRRSQAMTLALGKSGNDGL